MREKLSAKRRRRGTAQDGSSNDVYVDENYGDGDEASPEEEEEELETQLAEFTEKAIEELREKHFQHQQEIEAQKAQATIAVAVADAQLAFLDDLEPSSQAAAEPPAATSAAAQTPRARLDLTGSCWRPLPVESLRRLNSEPRKRLTSSTRTTYGRVLSAGESWRPMQRCAKRVYRRRSIAGG